ncbi:MAG: tripartite tricarboxylate transporter permease [Betaproteobacteria bacterium]|nr:MAG: tripartite tricarboxylate transporter permease [Betaproteobacteria bacterium]
METFYALLSGFSVALTLQNLLLGFVGVTLGTAVGVLPGVGPALTMALLLPATASVDPTGALIMFAGIYYGAMFGGSTTSILLNTPGESSTIVTAMEGNLMAKRGRAGAALATSAIGSFVAGTIATVLLTFAAPFVVDVALKFGPTEYFAVMVLAFTTVSAVLGASPARGMASLFLGLTIGLIGLDSQTGQARFTLGIPELLDGLDVVVVAVGLFAVGETLYVATFLNRNADTIEQVKGSIWMDRADWKRSWKPWLRGTALGFPFGCIPAGGAEIPTFLSYGIEKKLTRHPEEFGKGAIEGVAGPEAANNASASGTLMPLLTLGLPTTATAAIILAAFQQYGLQPGPLLFDTQPELVWGLIASMYVGNVILLLLNLPLVGVWVKLLSIPRPLLYAGILIFATLGAYGLRNSWFDLALLYGIGVMGFLMRRYDIPVAPVLVGMILGPLAEQQFRRALAISQGELSIFVTQPISATVLAITALVVIVPPIWRRVARMRAAAIGHPIHN